MYSDRKRQEIMDGYLEKDPSKTSKEILHEGYMLDMAGHTGTEIFWGAVLGIFLGALASLLILP
jgi:acid phosphatase family membrane protein YuiD